MENSIPPPVPASPPTPPVVNRPLGRLSTAGNAAWRGIADFSKRRRREVFLTLLAAVVAAPIGHTMVVWCISSVSPPSARLARMNIAAEKAESHATRKEWAMSLELWHPIAKEADELLKTYGHKPELVAYAVHAHIRVADQLKELREWHSALHEDEVAHSLMAELPDDSRKEVNLIFDRVRRGEAARKLGHDDESRKMLESAQGDAKTGFGAAVKRGDSIYREQFANGVISAGLELAAGSGPRRANEILAELKQYVPYVTKAVTAIDSVELLQHIDQLMETNRALLEDGGLAVQTSRTTKTRSPASSPSLNSKPRL